MSIYYQWHGNNEEEHLLLMAHRGRGGGNLFINGAATHLTGLATRRAGSSINVAAPDTEKIDVLPCSDLKC